MAGLPRDAGRGLRLHAVMVSAGRLSTAALALVFSAYLKDRNALENHMPVLREFLCSEPCVLAHNGPSACRAGGA